MINNLPITMWKLILLINLCLANNIRYTLGLNQKLTYGYECRQNKCLKVELNEYNRDNVRSLPACRMICGKTIGTIWPKPTGAVSFKSSLLHINYKAIRFVLSNQQLKLWKSNKERFLWQVKNKVPNPALLNKNKGYRLKIIFNFDDNKKSSLLLKTDESYILEVQKTDNREISAVIKAKTYFGARHGLETLNQLIVYDDIRGELQIISMAIIDDKPKYKWRGVLLDTSRNYYSVKAIKRTIDAMAMVKLNIFHWHITDSQSFPIEIKARPEMHKLGAYSSRETYTHKDIIKIVEYGRVRGVHVMPEFDAPAHVGEGWQHKNMTACFNAQPWKDFCAEPPCGQLDPTVDDMYAVLQDIYKEMFDLFHPIAFHMGGDEVSFKCWNSSVGIRNWMTNTSGWGLEVSDFVRLWGHFQKKALERVDNVAKGQKVPIILWTSTLTDGLYINDYLDKNRYIIQIWTKGSDPKVTDILSRGFPIIVSNYDALYFDCGGASWVADGDNWCPYIGWQKVYENRLESIAGKYINQVLGAEAAIWSEQIDEHTLDQRLWPRASALAERLWSNPEGTWGQAEPRMLMHRKRLVENGVSAQALQPEWCLQNENECPLEAYKV